MKPFYLQPTFLLGIFLGLSTCLLIFTFVPHHLHLSKRHRRDIQAILESEDTVEIESVQWTDLDIIDLQNHESSRRQRRDIKTIPDADDITEIEPEPWTPPDYPDITTELQELQENPDQETLSLDLELAQEKKKKSLLHAEILGGTYGSNVETAVQMTWASGGINFHVTSAGVHRTTAYQHVWDGVRQLCKQPLEEDWYILVKDNVYVNAERLQEILIRLSAQDSFVLGVPSAEHSHYCSLDAAVLFSRQALHTTCAIVERCAAQPHASHKEAFGHCLEKETGVTCSDVLKMSGSVHLTTSDPSSLHPQAALSKALFVGPVSTPDDLYKIHLVFTEHKITQMQQHVFWLAEQMDMDASLKQRAKRNSPIFEQTVLQSHRSILNSSAEPRIDYFDTAGYAYSDSCLVTRENISRSEGFKRSEYRVKRFLTRTFGQDVGRQDYFGFRTIKPLSGLEYQFYYMHEDQLNKRGYYYDKLYQIIVRQEYEKIRVEEKQTRDVEDITIVTIADDISLLKDLLVSLVENCVQISRSNSKCSVLLLYDTALFSTDSDMGQLQDIINNIDNQGVEIQTFNIGSSSNIMNNFQRAVVSVHETLTQNSLIVFLHPKSHITEHFLHRCQANTIPGASAYFPVPFQFTRDSNKLAFNHITGDSGFWKNTDFDTFCVHTKDLQKLLILPKSPQMLYQFLVSLDGIEVKRLADTGIWREWDEGLCDDHDKVQGHLQCQQDFKYRNL